MPSPTCPDTDLDLPLAGPALPDEGFLERAILSHALEQRAPIRFRMPRTHD